MSRAPLRPTNIRARFASWRPCRKRRRVRSNASSYDHTPLIDNLLQRCRCVASSLVDLALGEAGCVRVALDDRLTLSVAQDTLNGFKARRGEFLDFVDHTLRASFA